MNIRHEPDGTVTLTLEGGRSFTLVNDIDRGTLVIQSIEADIIVLPQTSSLIEIDTPLD